MEKAHTRWPGSGPHKCPSSLQAGAPSPACGGHISGKSPHRAPCYNLRLTKPASVPSPAHEMMAGLALEEGLWESPLLPCLSRSWTGTPLPHRATAQATTRLTGLSLAHGGQRYSLEPHADEGPELDVHLCVCSVVGHVHRLHSLGGPSCHSGGSSCQPRRPAPPLTPLTR